ALAAAAGATTVDLDLVEEGIALGIRAMEEMIAQQASLPVPGSGGVAVAGEVATAVGGATTSASACPFARVAAAQPEAVRALFPLDEVSVVSELERRRRELAGEQA